MVSFRHRCAGIVGSLLATGLISVAGAAPAQAGPAYVAGPYATKSACLSWQRAYAGSFARIEQPCTYHRYVQYRAIA